MSPFIPDDLSFPSEMCRAESEHHWVKVEGQQKDTEQRPPEGLEAVGLSARVRLGGSEKIPADKQSVFQ